MKTLLLGLLFQIAVSPSAPVNTAYLGGKIVLSANTTLTLAPGFYAGQLYTLIVCQPTGGAYTYALTPVSAQPPTLTTGCGATPLVWNAVDSIWMVPTPGAAGPQGPQGVPGTPGTPGAPGVQGVPGTSAASLLPGTATLPAVVLTVAGCAASVVATVAGVTSAAAGHWVGVTEVGLPPSGVYFQGAVDASGNVLVRECSTLAVTIPATAVRVYVSPN